MAYSGIVTEDISTPDQRRGRTVIRVAQSLGIITGGAYLILAYGRYPSMSGDFYFPAAAGVLALVAAGLATARARLSYWIFLAAAAATLLDLVGGYVHSLFFLGSFLILGSLCAINEPDDQSSLEMKNLMEE